MKSNDSPHAAMTRTLADKRLDHIPAEPEHEPERAREATKHELPYRPGEPPFGPRGYYYPASRSGVVPSWVAASSSKGHPNIHV
jgi:hypothetical protein